MDKINCAIIRDLIPSYLDGLCSEESGKAVDAHLQKCKECRTHLESLKHTELFLEKSNRGELDYMKKVKQYYARKNALGAILLFVPALIILPVIAKFHLNVETELYYIFFTVLALGACLLLSNYRTRPKHHWPVILSVTTGAAGALYATGLMAIICHCLETNTESFFGRKLSDIGPVFNSQLIGVVILELLVFAVCAADSVRKEYAFSTLPTLNLTCCSLCMCYRSLLFYMDSQYTLAAAVFQYIVNFILMTAGILLIEFVLLKIRSRLEIKVLGNI